MELRQKQSLFVKCLAQLYQYATFRGWEFTLAEGYIGDSIDKPGEDTPHKMPGNHFNRLAQDLNLFVGGEFIAGRTDQWLELGKFWEGLHPLCRWGGHFGDYNHFSLEHEGMI